MKQESAVRPCAVCGAFYPADPAALRSEVEEMIAAAGAPESPGALRGIVSPHAGYMYSGPTAAAAYARLAGRRFRTVVVVAPSHREAFAGVSVFPGAAYETPLGRLDIDAELREVLARRHELVNPVAAGHRDEHAIEVQLPFLQVMLGEFRLVPLVIGSQTRETCFSLGDLLGRECRDREVLLVASTDLSHYFPAAARREPGQGRAGGHRTAQPRAPDGRSGRGESRSLRRGTGGRGDARAAHAGNIPHGGGDALHIGGRYGRQTIGGRILLGGRLGRLTGA